ncbi:hypothetical protein FLGE108171_04500 [Flavobacterium gelidilacus]|uniref:hypothetical protein n=1 Tax=Flavobacterium gelidilacus TaxID=206041 RepID=UPI0039EEDF94
MKPLIIFYCLLSFNSYTQNKIFYIKNKDLKTLIPNVNVNFLNNTETKSDSIGRVVIKDSLIKELELSYIGFENLKLKILEIKDTVFLSKRKHITLKTKTKTKKVSPQFNLNKLFSFSNIGTGSPLHQNEAKAIFIPYDKKNDGYVISKIKLFPTAYNVISLDNIEKKITYSDVKYSPFWLNLYSVDTLSGMPDKKTFTENIKIQLKKNEKYATFTIDNYEKIDIHRNGIFIVIGSYNDEFYKKLNYKSAPAFKSTKNSKKSKFKQFNLRKPFLNDDEYFWEIDNWSWTHNSTYYFELELKKNN